MYTVAETEVFHRYAASIWSEAERVEFINWIAANPLAGDVISGSGGCRKVRWGRSVLVQRKSEFLPVGVREYSFTRLQTLLA